MIWNEFKENVERWAAERGIYEHSTPEAQLLKALSELGELADAVIKDDREALKDAIGDVAVCVINYAKMNEVQLTGFQSLLEAIGAEQKKSMDQKESIHYCIGTTAKMIGGVLSGKKDDHEDASLSCLLSMFVACHYLGLDFMGCCEQAWQEIKDRKVFLSKSGAFIKEG